LSDISSLNGPKPGAILPSPFDVGHGHHPEAIARTKAERAALVDEICNEFVADVPLNAAAITGALEGLEGRLRDLVGLATTYDGWISDVSDRLLKVVTPEDRDRVTIERTGAVYVDQHFKVERCRADRQLATVLLPVMRDLGAPRALLELLKDLAAAAPMVPTSGAQ